MTDSSGTSPRGWRQRGLVFAKGFCMGSADVVPGVSGGTMALILGIYQQFLEAIRSFDYAWLQGLLQFDWRTAVGRPHFGFVIPLLLGIFAALLFFTRVVPLPYLIDHYPAPVYGFFFGLISGSIVILVRQFDHAMADWLALVAATLAGLWLFNLVPAETPDSAWFIFISGALAISAMLLPGISGSFILLMLKKYSTVFAAIGSFNLTVLIPFILGALAGLIAFSRALVWLLRHYYQTTLAAIIGLLTASLWVIWPYQSRVYEQVAGKEKLIMTTPVWPQTWSGYELLALGLAVVGVALVLLLEWLARPRQDAE
ncbi:putative membrane protein [Methylohalomonas lacus]|uniref:Membrane protein n=1 Tax=Methylohalomonas lacus TaxID=398773 RepID=A0AAE3HLT8_9GAMM|nr:DUF368 domain-containing protein [Methylohalomonas lacus]MCS3904130.1 putative membrane protein [Methylohalomonas lacus]